MKKSTLLACALALLPVPVFAQTQRPPSDPRTGGYVAGIGGTTLGAASDKLFGGEIGVPASPNVTVYGTLGRMQNIAPKSVRDTFDGSGLTAKSPATFGIGGVKYRVPTSGGVRPYVVAGGGVGSRKLKVTAPGIGDVTDSFDQSAVKATKLMVEMGGGVEIPVGPLYVDTGYRFGKFVGLEDANVSRAYAGLGYRFGAK